MPRTSSRTASRTGACSCIRTTTRRCRPRSASTSDKKTDMFESVHRLRHRRRVALGDGRALALVDCQGRLRRLDRRRARHHRPQACTRRRSSARRRARRSLFGRSATASSPPTPWSRRVPEPRRRGPDGLAARGRLGRTIDDIFRGFHEETCEPLENPLAVAVRRASARSSRCGRCC